MKNRQFKKGLIIILMMLMLPLSVFGASNTDFDISGVVESSGSISEGESILYKLTIDNVSGMDFTDVKVYISGDFTLASGASFTYGDITDAQAALTKSIPVVYDGTGNKLNVLVDDGSGHSIIENITVGNVVETSTSTPSPVDKDRLYAEYNLLLRTSIPTFYAGQVQKFEFDLVNITTYSAYDVKVELVKETEDFPFDVSVNKLITLGEKINNKEKKSYSLSVTTNKNIESGFYTIPVKISFKNAYGLSKTISKNITIEVVSKEKAPIFVLQNVLTSESVLIPGKESHIQFTLKNLGTLAAKNMRITLEGLEMEGITLVGDTPTKTIARFAANDTDFVVYKINLSEDMTSNKKELTLKLAYFDEFGSAHTSSVPVYLKIDQSATSLYDLKVKITSVPTRVLPGQEFTVKFDVKNETEATHENIKMKIKSDGAFIYKSQPLIMIDSIEAGETQSYSYTLIADTNMTSNNYPTYITLEGKSGEVVENYLGIYVDGESGEGSKPKIIIDQFDFGKETILAGETFDLNITFFNTSNSIGIQNAKVAISSDEGAFVPVNASSSFFIESIGLREKVSHTITMKAKSDLNIKTYNITMAIEYEDSNGNSYDKNNNPYTANESMAIPVMQELRLEVEELSVEPFGFVYQPTELYVEFFNMGKATLSNMMVKTEGDFDIQDGKYFVGNFNPGTNDYYSCTLMPLTPGANVGKVIFEYEDALGEKHTLEKEFSIEAMEMEQNFDDGMMEFNEFPPNGELEAPQKSSLMFIIIVVMIVLLVVVIVVVRRKLKKKELTDE